MVKAKKFPLILIMSVMMTLLFVQSAFAWSGIGHVWANPGAPSYRFDPSYPSDLRTATDNAAYTWSAYPLHTMVWPNTSGTILFYSYDDPNTKTSGLTRPSINLLGYINGGTSWINSYISNKYTVLQKQSLVAHEMGHDLGLYESSVISALMYNSDAVRNDNETFQPRTDDITGINSLYP